MENSNIPEQPPPAKKKIGRPRKNPDAAIPKHPPRATIDFASLDIQRALITTGSVTPETAEKVTMDIERRFVAAIKPLHMTKRVMWNMAQKRQMFRRCVLRLEQIINGTLQELEFDRHGKAHIVFPNALNVIKACELLMAYCAGRPAQKVDVSVLNMGERDVTPRMEIVLNRVSVKEVQAITDAGLKGIKLNLGHVEDSGSLKHN